MTSPTRPGERAFFGLVFLVLPVAFWFAVVTPAQRRLEALNARIEAAELQIRDLPNYQPLSPEERKVLLDPAAPWRHRIPVIEGDRAKLAHYDRVVSLLQRQWGEGGITLEGVRSSWDPIQASFSLPGALPLPAVAPAPGGPGDLRAWVMEARILGDAQQLFGALQRVPRVEPLLEPVGLRWEHGPERRSQALWLRNLVLDPLPPPAAGGTP